MNWTEGNLARHSRSRPQNQLVARQKRHFAKARSRLFNRNAIQPSAQISLLGFEVDLNGLNSATRSLDRSRTDEFHETFQDRAENYGELGERRIQDAHATSCSQKGQEKSGWVGGQSPEPTRKRPGTAQDKSTSCEDTSDASQKKRRLLKTSDWVGLSMQPPAEIVLPKRQEASTKQRWGTTRARQAHSIRRRMNSMNIQVPGETTSQSELLPTVHPQNVLSARVQIGSQVAVPSISQESIAETKRYSLPNQRLVQSLRSSSSRNSSKVFGACVTSSSSIASGGRCSQSVYPTSENGSDFACQHQAIQSHAFSLSSHEAYPPVLFGYASSGILEPIPLRKDTSTLLQWSPSRSDGTDSLEVQVGRQQPHVPPHLARASETWRQWVAPSEPESARDSQRSSLSASKAHEAPSPGISEMNLQPGPMIEPQRIEIGSYALTTLDSSDTASGGERRFTTGGNMGKDVTLETIESRKGNSSDDDSHKMTFEEKSFEPQELHVSKRPAPVATKQKKSPEPDDVAWMNFVLDGNSDNLEEAAFREATQQVLQDRRLSDKARLCNSSPMPHYQERRDWASRVTFGPSSLISEALHQSPDHASSNTFSASHAATQGTPVEHIESDEQIDHLHTIQDVQEQKSRFAPPKPFVGRPRERHHDMDTESETPALPPRGRRDERSRGKGVRRSKRKKKAADGRTDIREIPDYDGDPIEEFD